MKVMAAIRAQRRSPLLHIVKSAVATLAGWLVALVLIPEGPPPVFAAIAALLVVQPSLNQSLLKGVERSIGVLVRSEEHTSELQSRENLVCRLLLEKKKIWQY